MKSNHIMYKLVNCGKILMERPDEKLQFYNIMYQFSGICKLCVLAGKCLRKVGFKLQYFAKKKIEKKHKIGKTIMRNCNFSKSCKCYLMCCLGKIMYVFLEVLKLKFNASFT